MQTTKKQMPKQLSMTFTDTVKEVTTKLLSGRWELYWFSYPSARPYLVPITRSGERSKRQYIAVRYDHYKRLQDNGIIRRTEDPKFSKAYPEESWRASAETLTAKGKSMGRHFIAGRN